MHHTIDPVMATGFQRVGHAMADAARRETLRHFRVRGLGADNKDAAGFDPVTIADRAAEAAMCAVLAQERPDDGILGEEEGAKPGTSGLTWVLDPIDGTRGFISGTPTWGVLIALQDASGPIYGIIDQPYIAERFEGGFGVARCVGPTGETTLAVSDTRTLSEATILTTFPEVGTDAEARAFHAVAKQCKLTRYGMDCYAYALLAAGHVDLVIEAGLNAYDVAAPIAVVQAAGGIVTDWSGQPAHEGGRIIAAATPELHSAALEVISNAL
ncbi:histidinol-phosphatase [Thalassobacter stenotrophicus]|uniref:histidinol-phosphatase n=1 Tax=Thalassobacter stenotrophicus TaxID=266809 RepID=UPI0022A92664|nr:histidinol-phosphatase [Thalassobacter stenotrophicus]UYP66578.1 histidinol-phosphatase [Thalassobacter stenotrophicus]